MPVDALTNEVMGDLEEIEGVRIYGINSDTQEFRVGMRLPGGGELCAVVDAAYMISYMDVEDTPEVTPPCFLKVYDLLMEYKIEPPTNYRAEGKRWRKRIEEREADDDAEYDCGIRWGWIGPDGDDE